MTRVLTLFLLSSLTGTACNADLPGSSHAASAVATSNVVADVPAVDRVHYPDSIGFLYQSDLASVFWLQNHPAMATLDDLQRHLANQMSRGLSGEILSSAMQHVDATTDAEPALPDMAKRSAQSVKLLVQYQSMAHDYAQALADGLNAYNTDPARRQNILDTVDQVEALFATDPAVHPAGLPPAPPPPPGQDVIRPAQYFADAFVVHERANLANRARDLQRAIDAHNAALYGDAFIDVYSMQRNVDIARDAVTALAAHHEDGVLKGQPLDVVIATYVLRPPDADNPYSPELLSLINQVNLLSNDLSVARQALVAALLLIDEDHQQHHADATLSFSLIWDHVADQSWLVSQYVRIKGNGMTTDQANTMIDGIVASL